MIHKKTNNYLLRCFKEQNQNLVMNTGAAPANALAFQDIPDIITIYFF